jgi:hypothetical protein
MLIFFSFVFGVLSDSSPGALVWMELTCSLISCVSCGDYATPLLTGAKPIITLATPVFSGRSCGEHLFLVIWKSLINTSPRCKQHYRDGIMDMRWCFFPTHMYTFVDYVHWKKISDFSFPAGMSMSLTKLSLVENNLIIPGQGEFG